MNRAGLLPSDGDDEKRIEQIRAVTRDYMNRCFTGDRPSIQSLLDQYPELLPELEVELRRVQVIAAAGADPTDDTRPVGGRRGSPADHLSEWLRQLEGDSDSSGHNETRAWVASGTEGQEPSKESLPETIDRFEIRELLGRGGFGSVYLGFDARLERDVAIKVSHRGSQLDDESVANYLQEARNVAALDHPNIVPVYDAGRTESGQCYVVSKFIAGQNLARRLVDGDIPVRDAALWCAQVARALDHAHSRGIIHRDIKPANILLDDDRTPYVVDFGLAMRADGRTSGQSAGTPAYMSPEQARGEGHLVNRRSDVFSLGIVFYELLTGERPFQSSDSGELRRLIQRVDPLPPRDLDHTIPSELERICLKAIAKLASQRHATAAELAEDLEHFLTEPKTRPDQAEPAVALVPRGLSPFDHDDHEFYLELLPGLRDRNGLPSCLSFWLRRLDDVRPDQRLRVGLIYGPSGSGKSSFVRAGLLPVLGRTMNAIYLEATPDRTEVDLHQRLVRHFPSLVGGLTLAEAMSDVRRGHAQAAGTRQLVIIDQFEQWLCAKPEHDRQPLIDAMRQCDGRSLQCLLLVRDEFWTAISQLMQQLEIPIVEHDNSQAVARFDPSHARHVLQRLGQASGALPKDEADISERQKQFLNHAIQELFEASGMVPIKLILLVRMLEGLPWSAATLKQYRGLTGVGTAYLDKLFGPRSTVPEYRSHAPRVRGILDQLVLPASPLLRGSAVGHDALLQAVGGERESCLRALNLLTHETRLVTEVEVETETGVDPRAYQLTHDYWVPAIREWLDQYRMQSRRGRAARLLAERAPAWHRDPAPQRLLTLFEWLHVACFAPQPARGSVEQQMLAASRRYYLTRSCLILGLLITIGCGAFQLDRYRRAHELVDVLQSTGVASAPEIVDQLRPLKSLVIDELDDMRQATEEELQLKASLLRLRDEPDAAALVSRQLLTLPSGPFFAITDWLARQSPVTLSHLEPELAVVSRDSPLRMAVVRAALRPTDPIGKDQWQWAELATQLVANVQADPPSYDDWTAHARPLAVHLKPHLLAIHANDDTHHDYRSRQLASEISLTLYGNDVPHLLQLLESGDEVQFRRVLSKFVESWASAEPTLQQRCVNPDASPADGAPVRSPETRSRRAVALAHVGETVHLSELLRLADDATELTLTLHWMQASQLPLERLVSLVKQANDHRQLQPLLVALGRLDGAGVDAKTKQQVRHFFAQHPNAGVHSAAAWALRRWGEQPANDLTSDANHRLTDGPGSDSQDWATDSRDRSYKMVHGPVEFDMGTPGESRRAIGGRHEEPHRRRISYSFAVCTTEITSAELLEMLAADDTPPLSEGEARRWRQATKNFSLNCPQLVATWYQAAQYCNWLSQQEGVPRDQWCFEPNDDGQYGPGMRIVDDVLSRSGYRLPTESEWEYVCRAGTSTPRPFGRTLTGLADAAWYDENAEQQPHPVGVKQPNAWGLFDMLGNAFEWCLDVPFRYPKNGDRVVEHIGEMTGRVLEDDWRVLRGGSFASTSEMTRSAYRYMAKPGETNTFGFRLARTLP